MKIKESNIILAEFMGWQSVDGIAYITTHLKKMKNGEQSEVYLNSNLKFDISDEWLEAVMDRIEGMGVFILFPDERTVEIRYKHRDLVVNDDISKYKVVVQAVIFIDHCNEIGLPIITVDDIDELPVWTIFDRGIEIINEISCKWVAMRTPRGWVIIYGDKKYRWDQIADFRDTLTNYNEAESKFIRDLINGDITVIRTYLNLQRKGYERRNGTI